MNPIEQRYFYIKHQMDAACLSRPDSAAQPQLIAVSKRQSEAKLRQLLELGHRQYGENQVQEAYRHWESLKKDYPDVRLHLIGPLQSNKTKEAVGLFDVIQTIDREKIARLIKVECGKQQKEIDCFIQINIGEEPQKAGIAPSELTDFLSLCRNEIGLSICGLMAIPPEGVNPAPYFALMQKLAGRHGLAELSMGMSGDYETAIRFGATYVRVGTALFGERESD